MKVNRYFEFNKVEEVNEEYEYIIQVLNPMVMVISSNHGTNTIYNPLGSNPICIGKIDKTDLIKIAKYELNFERINSPKDIEIGIEDNGITTTITIDNSKVVVGNISSTPILEIVGESLSTKTSIIIHYILEGLRYKHWDVLPNAPLNELVLMTDTDKGRWMIGSTNKGWYEVDLSSKSVLDTELGKIIKNESIVEFLLEQALMNRNKYSIQAITVVSKTDDKVTMLLHSYRQCLEMDFKIKNGKVTEVLDNTYSITDTLLDKINNTISSLLI